MTKKIAVLGAAGSVGMQALDVARARGYDVDLIVSNKNVNAVEQAIREFSPSVAVMADECAARDLSVRIRDTSTAVFSGSEAICTAVNETSADTVINAILGEAGLMPTVAALQSKKRLALSNKESLVIAGEEVMRLSRENEAQIIPVDSEHSAIFQCLLAGKRKEVSRLLITASGGSLYGKSREEMRGVTLDEVLLHPTWKMGKKITVDSATLMNKGFEIIEASHLFDIPEEHIEVLIHRESILHSAVEYIDNAVITQMSLPDMRQCVQYAVDYPCRANSDLPPLDLAKIGRLSFSQPDTEAFPLLTLARKALSDGGAMGAVLNAADEEAVDAFIRGKIAFSDIADAVFTTYDKMQDAQRLTSIDDILSASKTARTLAAEYVTSLAKKRSV